MSFFKDILKKPLETYNYKGGGLNPFYKVLFKDFIKREDLLKIYINKRRDVRGGIIVGNSVQSQRHFNSVSNV
jgi:ribosomal protein S18